MKLATILLSRIFLLSALVATIRADDVANVTITSDNTTAITYQPANQWTTKSFGLFDESWDCTWLFSEGEQFSNTTADSASILFEGTAVYWYGLVRANSGPSTFTAVLDGIPTAFDIPNLTCHEPGQTDLCCQALYSQTGLAAQTHSLAIVNTGSLSHNDNLDFSVVAFLYTPSPLPKKTSSSDKTLLAMLVLTIPLIAFFAWAGNRYLPKHHALPNDSAGGAG